MSSIVPANSMPNARRRSFVSLSRILSPLLLLTSYASASEIPAAVAAKDKTQVATVHAEGVQIYECKTGADGELGWQFREPLATLMVDGKTVGRHFAGPGWEFDDGSMIRGKVAAQAAGATKKDIPVLLLDVVEHRGRGKLSDIISVQRLETKGGVYGGTCQKAGELHMEPYSANYIFLK